jgi:DNA-binding NtrC family response regulator
MTRSVLVIESDYLSRWFLSKTMETMGYRVMTVPDVSSALKKLDVDTFHAVIVRVDQYELDRKNAMDVIRAAHPDVRVVAYAPHAGNSLKAEFDRLGVGYFLHPFRSNEIRQAMTHDA